MEKTSTTAQNELQMDLEWTFVENVLEDGNTSAVFRLKNNSGSALGDQGWSIYYSQMGRGPVEGSVGGGVGMEHVNGDLHRISPLPGFSLPAGESLEIPYLQPGWQIKNSSSPSGPFFVVESEGSREVFTFASFTAHPLKDLQKVFPEGSGRQVPDAEWFFGQNALAGSAVPVKPEPVPGPQSFETSGSLVSLDLNGITPEEGLEQEADYLAEMLELVSEGSIPIFEGSGGSMIMGLDPSAGDRPGAYRLKIDDKGSVRIAGVDAAGVRNGINSLLSLLPVEAWAEAATELKVPVGIIKDAPAFEYRGIHLDLARNFFDMESIKKLIRAMSWYKLNKLHLHLVDDEGWRLEIPSLPELAEVGAFRQFDPKGTSEQAGLRMIPAYGSGPFANAEGNNGVGYISRDAFIELLQFADKHHVEVIPEINFPGHARAAIAAMETRYERLLKAGKSEEEASWYRLIDPEDRSVYNSAQNFHDNVACACYEGLYRLFETVVDDILDMYNDAGLKLNILHTGGDEVPHGSWTASPICLDFAEKHPGLGGVENLQAYVGARFYEILEKRGLVMGGWEEVAMKKDEKGRWIPNPDFTSQDILPYVWNNMTWNIDLGYRLANSGFEVVLCNVTNFYFDLAYTPHPEEPGLFWGGFVDTRKNYIMQPYDIYQTTYSSTWGDPYDPEKDFASKVRLEESARKNIRGLQAELWSETIHGGEMLESYYMPKLIGFAERAWAGEVEGDVAAQWARFASLIGQRELPRLDHLFGGFNYRIPPPGARIVDGVVEANCGLPGLEIRYTTDGSEPTAASELYSAPFAPGGDVRLATFDARGRRSLVTELKLN